MNHKTKSILYFASLVIAVMTYYMTNDLNKLQNTELAENTIEHVSSPGTLN